MCITKEIIKEGTELYLEHVKDKNFTQLFKIVILTEQVDIYRQKRFKNTLLNLDNERNQDYKKVMTQKFVKWIDPNMNKEELVRDLPKKHFVPIFAYLY